MDEINKEKKPRRKTKKVKGHGAHHGGGAWKVAYADFVTAMMALFLVLWLVSQADTKLKQAIASYFRSPGIFNSMDGGILAQAKKVSKEPTIATSKDDEQMLFTAARELQKQFDTRPEFSRAKDQVKIDITDEGLRIQLIDKADRVSFPSGSPELTPEAQAILTEIAAGLCELPNRINIGGHTDSHVFASVNNYTNWELSADRANAARRVLESVCVKPEQIHRIVGFADTEPMVPEDPFAPANRRISITVLRLENQPADGNQSSSDKPEILSKAPPAANPVKLPATAENGKRAAAGENADSQVKEKSLNAAADKADKTIKAKLLNEGVVKIGEPDTPPVIPK